MSPAADAVNGPDSGFVAETCVGALNTVDAVDPVTVVRSYVCVFASATTVAGLAVITLSRLLVSVTL